MSWQQRFWYEDLRDKLKLEWLQSGNEKLTYEMKLERLELTLTIVDVTLEDDRLTEAELRGRYQAIGDENTYLTEVRNHAKELRGRIGDTHGLMLWIERNKMDPRVKSTINSTTIAFEDIETPTEDTLGKIGFLNSLRLLGRSARINYITSH